MKKVNITTQLLFQPTRGQTSEDWINCGRPYWCESSLDGIQRKLPIVITICEWLADDSSNQGSLTTVIQCSVLPSEELRLPWAPTGTHQGLYGAWNPPKDFGVESLASQASAEQRGKHSEEERGDG